MKTLCAAAWFAASMPVMAFAQPGPQPPPAPGPSLTVATEAAEAAVKACDASGYKVTALVVASDETPVALLRADGARAGTIAIATRKAHTAMTYKMPTSEVAEKVKTDKAMADAIAADKTLITWQGAQLLMSGDQVLGAMAVSGAPGGDKDDACVTAALAEVKGRY